MGQPHRAATDDDPGTFRIIGVSSASNALREQTALHAAGAYPVLISGDSGTGKEVIARTLHHEGPWRVGPFFAINCATLGSLAESEFFGHRRGAFPGATVATRGYVGAAEGGVLFLDGVDQLPRDVQAKVLRFLDTGEYHRLGEGDVRRASVRVLSSTNVDLLECCASHLFRTDLYYRLAAVTIRTVPLRERREDIPLFISHFIEIHAGKRDTRPRLDPEALGILVAHDWPGNVRQLLHTVQVLVQARRETILPEDVTAVLETWPRRFPTYREAKEQAIAAFDREYFRTLLRLTRGNLKATLEASGMHKKNLYEKLKVLGLNLRHFKPAD